MTRQEVLRRLKEREPELRQLGLGKLYLFGSTADGTATLTSDIDLACDLADDRPISLLDFIDLKQRLKDVLGKEVDLVERQALHPRVRQRVDRQMVKVF
jgi:uncharacterized protein